MIRKKIPSTLIVADALDFLGGLDSDSVDVCVTSPPYFRQRDYGDPQQIGRERFVDDYVEKLGDVFEELLRVTKDTGTLWLNLGDKHHKGELLGVPWLVAFELKRRGWRLIRDVIWAKSNPIPESHRRRPTSSHEFLFMFAKSPDYFYDYESTLEDGVIPAGTKAAKGSAKRHATPGVNSRPPVYKVYDGKRARRDVWTTTTGKTIGGNYAGFPTIIPAACIEMSSRPGDLVVDPFMGEGTTAVAARVLKRRFAGSDLVEKFVSIARTRIRDL